MSIRTPQLALSGLAGWFALGIGLGRHEIDEQWAALLTLFAILMLAPLLFQLAGALPAGETVRWLAWATGAVAAMSMIPAQGAAAAAHVFPWLMIVSASAWHSARRAFRRGLKPASALAIDAGLIYLPVGAIWLAFARAGVRPLGFDPQIVQLTAAHFHYAGFALPIVTGLAVQELKRTSWRIFGTIACIGVIAGVPMTAIGITVTQLHRTHAIETLAAWTMAGSGVLVALLHLRLAVASDAPPLARLLWGIAGLSLVGGMALAALYASRYLLPIPALDIPTMRALHGTINAMGFALPATVGWMLQSSGRDSGDLHTLSRP